MKTLMKFAAIALLATAVTLAQPARQRGSQLASPSTAAAGLNLSATVTLNGTVTAVNVATASQYPTISLNGTVVKVAPVWFLLENDFEIETGHQLVVRAAPALLPTGYYYALEVENLTTQKSIQLRDASGRPLWFRAPGLEMGLRGESPGSSSAAGAFAWQARAAVTYGGCLDTNNLVEITGQIVEIDATAGIRQPAIVLDVGGKLVTVRIGPLRVLFATDLELAPGDVVSVIAAQETCTGNLVALKLSVGDQTVQLRNPDGRPAW